MSYTAIITLIIISLSALFGVVALTKLGSQLQKFGLQETSDTLLFKVVHLKYFTIFYVLLFCTYSALLIIFVLAFNL